MQHILILAGGSGTRLWPLSHQGEPKQLLELIDGVSLLRMAYERVAGLVPDANILVCTGSSYADTVAKLLPEVPAENILGEPVGRDSLNAVAWPAAMQVVIVAVISGATTQQRGSRRIPTANTTGRSA